MLRISTESLQFHVPAYIFSFVFASGFCAHKAVQNYRQGRKAFDLSRVQLFEMFYPPCAVNLDDVLICQTSCVFF